MKTYTVEITEQEYNDITRALSIVNDNHLYEDEPATERRTDLINQKLEKLIEPQLRNTIRYRLVPKTSLIILESVGSILDVNSLMIYPQPATNQPIDFMHETALSECSEEWNNSLSDEDQQTINNIKKALL